MKSIAKAHAARITSLSLVLLMLAVMLLSVIIPLAQIAITPHQVQAAGQAGTFEFANTSGTTYWTVPANVTSVQVLVVAGGGGGGGMSSTMDYCGGGGGAGGVLYNSAYSVTPGASITITVGGGGSGVSGDSPGGNGGSSSFNVTMSATGGGGGASGAWDMSNWNGNGGGSGGGGASDTSAAGSGGSGTSGQGNAGGTGFEDGTYGHNGAGGGGGAGGANNNGASKQGGAGGAGVDYSSSALFGITYGASGWFAGGGGGSSMTTGGSATAGGGKGGSNGAGTAATDNTGGGGGGGGSSSLNTKGGKGGSGIVIVKYTLYNLAVTAGSGGSTSPAGGGIYLETAGTAVTVIATPDSCHTFSSWSGDTGTMNSTSSATATITMTGNYSITANFAYKTYALNVNASPSAGGTASGGGSSINCGTNTSVTATANPCYTFTSWTQTAGLASNITIWNNTSLTTNITVNGIANVTANFALNSSSTLNVNATAGGTASFTGGSGPFTCGTNATVVATANPCYTFTGWTQTAGLGSNITIFSPSATTTNIMVNGTANVTANFALNTSTLNVNATAGGTASFTGSSGPFNCGTNATIVATANPCYTFVNWTQTAGLGSNITIFSPSATTTNIMVNGTANVTANFAINTSTLNINASPAGGGTTSFTGGSGPFNCGTNATVSATTNSGYTFVNWTQTAGLGSNITIFNPSATTTNVMVNGTANVTANYNTAPTITSVTLQKSDKVNATSSMTPQIAYNLKIVAGDADTINDINQIDIWIFYEPDSSHNGSPSETWDCDQEAIYRWTKSGSTWSMQNGSAVTTWGITTASCDTPSPMTATTGTWNLYFTVGKLVIEADGTNTAWDIKVLVTDSVSQTASNTSYSNLMGSYASLALSSGTINFGNMSLGSIAAIQTPASHYVTLQVISNNVFSLGGKSSSPWTSGSNSISLDTSGTPTTAGTFALTYDDAGDGIGNPTAPQAITTSTVTITGHNADARTSTAAGASESTNSTNIYMDCKLNNSGIPYGTYSGTITFTITN